MKKLLLFFLVIFAIGSVCWADTDEDYDCFGPDECKFKLDEAAFRSSIVKRVNAGLKTRGKAEDFISEKNVEILKTWPFALGPFQLVSVKVRITPANKSQRGGISFVVVDSSGRYDVRSLADLSTGEDVRFKAMAIVRHEDLPENFGYNILDGTGASKVVMISDPMCYHCKSAFRYLLAKTLNIKTMEMVHYFRRGDHDSEISTRLILYAIKHNIMPVEVIKFAYTELTPPKIKGSNEELIKMIKVTILNQFYEEFPKLKELLGNDTQKALETLEKETEAEAKATEEKVEPFGITGTPIVFIDGMRIDGFKPDIYNKAFREDQENQPPVEIEGG